MVIDTMAAQVSGNNGFFAALDQSGGSTPGALRLYGIPDSAYSSETEMFALMHAMRSRIIMAPAFVGTNIIGTILFEQTMDREIQGTPVPAFLWRIVKLFPSLRSTRGLRRSVTASDS